MSAKAKAALQALNSLASRSQKHVCYTPPEMTPAWEDSYDKELMAATQTALDAGTDPQAVYKLLERIAAVDLEMLPPKYMAACINAGLSPDTDVGGESLLHNLINHPFPPPLNPPEDSPAAAVAVLKQLPPGRNPAAGTATLNELLARKPRPNLEDAAGNTAMHMLVACMVQKVHFPDPQLPDQGGQAGEDGDEVMVEGSIGQDAAPKQERQQQEPAAAGEPEALQQLEDNDATRAAYAQVAFQMLLNAGWEPGWRNHNGYSVSQLIEAGLAKYQTELYDLQDPDGVAQTTVALLSERAPDKNLREFLQAKVAGVKAVVDCLQVMHGLAAAADRPRQTRSAVSLVGLWLLLLLVMLYWMYSRQQKAKAGSI